MRIADKLTTTHSRGTYTFANMAQFLAGVPSRFQGNTPDSNFHRQRPNTLFGFYLQDDYRVTSKVTLNLGLRYEFFTVPKDKNGLDAYLPDVRTSPDTVLGGPFVNPSLEAMSRRASALRGMSAATAAPRFAAAAGSTTTPTVRSTARWASRLQSPPFVNVVNISGAGIPFPTPVFSTLRPPGHAEHAHDGLPHQAAEGRDVQRQRPARACGRLGNDGRLRRLARVTTW